jgi:adenylosuccinate synthase
MVISLEALQKELIGFDVKQIRISDRAHLLFPFHQMLDAQSEQTSSQKIGTTQKGIGPAYQTKTARTGIRVGSLRDLPRLEGEMNRLVSSLGISFDVAGYLQTMTPFIQTILPQITDTSYEVYQAYHVGKRILFEGAQGVMLDLDHGTYPFVTSSNTVSGTAASGSGLGPNATGFVLGIVKAYTTRVGSGPFPTELEDEIGQRLGERGHEFGTVTGRKRRCGWFDAVIVRQSCAVSGVTGIALTKLDVLDGFETIRICTGYRLNGKILDYLPSHAADQANVEPIYEEMPGWQETTAGARSWADLPAQAIKYVQRIQELIETPVALVSTSPEREDTILVRDPFAD